MLSFLIPTYNYDCTSLVLNLFQQATVLTKQMKGDFDFEIIVADDASTNQKIKEAYVSIENLEKCRFLALDNNMGRAKIRNFLVSLAKYDHVVFIDCDAKICTDDFVRQYWEHRYLADVVCGALRNPEQCPQGGELRFKYERSATAKRTLSYRNAHPYTYFTTFNVLFRREIFCHIQFDERCTEYGYEDALMGLMLQQEGYKVAHIDNPLIHNGIDMSAIYLDKVETSLRVLYRLGEPLQSASALVRLERKLKSIGLFPLLVFVFRRLQSKLRTHLTSQHPSMSILKFYKLGYYAQLEQESTE